MPDTSLDYINSIRAQRMANGTWSGEDEAAYRSVSQAAAVGEEVAGGEEAPYKVPYYERDAPRPVIQGKFFEAGPRPEQTSPVGRGGESLFRWYHDVGEYDDDLEAEREFKAKEEGQLGKHVSVGPGGQPSGLTIPQQPMPMRAVSSRDAGPAGFSGFGSAFTSRDAAIGINLQKSLGFLPDYLRPATEGYLPPDFMDDLEAAYSAGEISEDDFGKAMDVVSQYKENSILGTSLEAERAGRDVRDYQARAQADELNLDAKFKMAAAEKQLEMIDDLENSDALFKQAEDHAREEMDKQIATIKQRVNDLNNNGGNSWGDAWGGVFTAIAAGLGGVASSLSRTPNYAMEAINTGMNARMNQMALESSNKRAQLTGEMNIYQLLREDLGSERAAHHASKLSLIQRTQLEIDAMAGQSASMVTRQRAQAMIGQLGLQAAAEEKALLAEITNQVQMKKLGFLSGAAGNLKKRKDALVETLQAQGKTVMMPIKDYTPVSSRLPGLDLQGFAPDKMANGINAQMEGIANIDAALSDLESLGKKVGFISGVSGFWGDDKLKHDAARSQFLLGIRSLNTGIGALDKGVQEVADPMIVDLEGPVDAFFSEGNLLEARRQMEALKSRVYANAQPHVIPGQAQVILDSEGKGELKWIVTHPSEGQIQSMHQASEGQAKFVPGIEEEMQ